jgi:TetR/AcrR family transcriptional repressor of nem operon
MDAITPAPRRRGRPTKTREALLETREALLRAGLEVLTEKGFSASGLDEILTRAGVPKGSFYHYFENKDAFGQALITRYADYFARKLERHFSDATHAPLARIRNAIADLQAGMLRHEFRRGCLVGNLGQEMGSLPEPFRAQLSDVFADWQQRLARCLREAQAAGEIPVHIDCDEAAAFFWIGWEGAVLRAKLERRMNPLELFVRHFFTGLQAAP